MSEQESAATDQQWSAECSTCIMGRCAAGSEEEATELARNHSQSNPDHDAYVETPDGDRIDPEFDGLNEVSP